MTDAQQFPPSSPQGGHEVPPHAGSRPAAPASEQAPAAQPTLPVYGTPPPQAPNGAPAAGNQIGKIAFIIAAITLGINLMFTPLTQIVIMSGGYMLAGPISAFSGFIGFLGAAAALVLGIIALRRPAPHALAGIAVGAGGVLIANIIVSGLMGVFYSWL